MSVSNRTALKRQRMYVEEYAARIGLPPVEWFEDNDISGIRDDRDDYQRFLTRVEGGDFSHVVFFKLDRMARDDVEILTQVRRMLKRNVEVHDTRVTLITETNVGVLAMLARMELEANSQRTMAALKALARQGYKLGRPPLGYRWDVVKVIETEDGPKNKCYGRVVPDETAGSVMAKVLEMAADPTCSLAAARRYLNEKLGLHKDDTEFKRIICNPYYYGLNINCMELCSVLEEKRVQRPQDYWEYTWHEHPLCTKETWDAIQHRLARRKTAYRNPVHPASSLTGLLYCARCNRRMYPHYPRAARRQYRCRVCGFQRAESFINPALEQLLATIDTDPSHAVVVAAESVEKTRVELERQRDADRSRLKEIGKERGALTRQRVAGNIADDDYQEALSQSDDEREQLRARIAMIEGALANMARGADLSHVTDHVDRLRLWCAQKTKTNDVSLDVDEMRTRWQFVADAITIDPATNTLTVTWSPELAMVTGQQSASVALKGRTRRLRGATTGA